jgi:hypothetical protein
MPETRQPKQSPSTGESTKDQEKHVPASGTPADVTEKPDVSRSGASAHEQQSGRADKGPKSGGTGPKQ